MPDIKLLDGGMGTGLWAVAEREGVEKVPVWTYNITHPEFVEEVTRRYVDAGSYIVQSNTFAANRMSLAHEKVDYSVADCVKAAVRIGRKAVEGTESKVSLDIGPLTQLLKPFGPLSAEDCEDIYREIIEAGASEGPDVIVLETFMDLEMMKIAAKVAKETGLPVFCSMTFEKKHRTLMGNSVKQIIKELTKIGVDVVGMNCSLGPDMANGIIEEFASLTDMPLMYKPNAGMPVINPDGTEYFPCGPEQFSQEVSAVLDKVSYIGGCCGSTPEHIAALKELVGK